MQTLPGVVATPWVIPEYELPDPLLDGPETLATHDPERGVVGETVTLPAQLPNACHPRREPPESSKPGLTNWP
jgi:hypothetical protein